MASTPEAITDELTGLYQGLERLRAAAAAQAAAACHPLQTNSAVYHVFWGEGYTIVNGERVSWKAGDFFVIPPWAWHEHANDTREDSILFSVQDTPILQALGLCREQAYEANDGYQAITREFHP